VIFLSPSGSESIATTKNSGVSIYVYVILTQGMGRKWEKQNEDEEINLK
jgi:hypothetical protein